MTCPHCGHRFALTLRRYWSSPLYRHRCPSCSESSRLRLTPAYLTTLVLWASASLGPAYWLVVRERPPSAAAIAIAALATLLYLEVDRHVQTRLRPLVPHDGTGTRGRKRALEDPGTKELDLSNPYAPVLPEQPSR